MPYTIIIPIHNEEKYIPTLLRKLQLITSNHEIIIINDGSTDSSNRLLSDCSFIKLVSMDKNYGKGGAIRKGLYQATYEKIIILDGDLELDPVEIGKLMILDKNSGIECVFGSRYVTIKPFSSLWEFGNYFLTGLFNIIHGAQLTDALCCAKAFYKDDVKVEKLYARGFDIDVELASTLSKKIHNITTVNLSYYRRYRDEGKKLRFRDGWKILNKILFG